MIKTCPICSKNFETPYKTVTCSNECVKAYRKKNRLQWNENNPDKHQAIIKRAQQKRKENGNQLAYQKARRVTKEGYADRFMERIKIRTSNTDITREFLLSVFDSHCAITGKPFEYKKTYDAYHNALAPSIDRIDSKKGYYKDNIQVILACINRMKNDMPNEQFLQLWKALTNDG